MPHAEDVLSGIPRPDMGLLENGPVVIGPKGNVQDGQLKRAA